MNKATTPEQYRITKISFNRIFWYHVTVTYGLLDTATMVLHGKSSWGSVKECHEAIKEHASYHGISNPIILR